MLLSRGVSTGDASDAIKRSLRHLRRIASLRDCRPAAHVPVRTHVGPAKLQIGCKTSWGRDIWRVSRRLIDTVGATRLSTINGKMIRRWHAQWTASGARNARGCLQTLRRVVKYGVEFATRRDQQCVFLAGVLSHMRFAEPPPRGKHATYEQVANYRAAAIASGRFSIALAVSLQFDLGLRQKDVIGEWVPVTSKSTASIRSGGRIWGWGVLWSHIDSDWVLRKPTSKSNGERIAEHDLKLYPETLALLQEVPQAKRMGPIIIDEGAGRPYNANFFHMKFRKIARTCDWPDDLWNMDLRAGAISEAFAAGADQTDVMSTVTHSQFNTTMGYNRCRLTQSSRVAQLRMAKRKRDGLAPI